MALRAIHLPFGAIAYAPMNSSLFPHSTYSFMRITFLFSAFCLVLVSFGFARDFLAHPDAHEIIRKIALEEYAPIQTSLPITINLPKTWKYHAAQDGIAFWVPYHNGVSGHIQKHQNTLSYAEMVNYISEHYSTSFQSETHENCSLPSVNACEKGTLSGRMGGEEWRLFVSVVTLPDNTTIVYHASAPILWFASYAPLFADILASFAPQAAQQTP